MGAFNYVTLNLHIDISKISRGCIVGIDAAYLCGSKNNIFGLFGFEKLSDFCLISKIQFGMSSTDYICIAGSLKRTDNGTSYQSTVSGNIDFCILVQHYILPFQLL